MAMIIAIIVAILVAVGLVSMNVRAASPRNRDSAGNGPGNEGNKLSNEDKIPAGSNEQSMPNLLGAEGEDHLNNHIIQDEHKMKDYQYRQALKRMTGTGKQDTIKPAAPVSKQRMKDQDYREILKTISKQKNDQ
ncbi:hypothetical protein [Peribacillus sp. SCS-155]|uniref:hypothetical protein n=1 Tax=Peribacillus sedimenti TaxID=3115297 RepID=UPI0039064231